MLDAKITRNHPTKPLNPYSLNMFNPHSNHDFSRFYVTLVFLSAKITRNQQNKSPWASYQGCVSPSAPSQSWPRKKGGFDIIHGIQREWIRMFHGTHMDLFKTKMGYFRRQFSWSLWRYFIEKFDDVHESQFHIYTTNQHMYIYIWSIINIHIHDSLHSIRMGVMVYITHSWYSCEWWYTLLYKKT